MDLNIDWSLIDNIEDPVQKEFFKDLKKRHNAGEELDPDQILKAMGELMGRDNPEAFNKLVNLNEQLRGVVDSFKGVKL